MEPPRKTVVSRRVPLPTKTVTGLLETVGALMAAKDKPTRILYQRGEDLYVEVPEFVEPADIGAGLVTPYQMVRQHCDVTIMHAEYLPTQDPLRAFCELILELRKTARLFTAVVVPSLGTLRKWLPIDISQVFGVPILVDADTPAETIFLCGSTHGDMIKDFECAVAVQLRGD
jgi:hypothetical protein